MRCDHCGSPLVERIPRVRGYGRLRCPSCELYNAAVEACQAAAAALAKERNPGSTVGRAWLNEFGFFAQIDGVHVVVGTAAEVAPFVALTGAALKAGKI